MTPDDFQKVLAQRIERINAVLGQKAREYAKNNDRLHNFKRAAKMLGQTPEQALMGMLAKHMVSIMDMVDDSVNPEIQYDAKQWDEKIGDAVNYLILLEGLAAERINENFDRAIQNETYENITQ